MASAQLSYSAPQKSNDFAITKRSAHHLHIFAEALDESIAESLWKQCSTSMSLSLNVKRINQAALEILLQIRGELWLHTDSLTDEMFSLLSFSHALVGFRYGGSISETAARALSNAPCLKSLRLEGFKEPLHPIILTSSSLTEILLSRKTVSEEAAALMAKNTSLTALSFHHCQFDKRAFSELSESNSLTALYILHCSSTSDAANLLKIPTLSKFAFDNPKMGAETWLSVAKASTQVSLNFLYLPLNHLSAHFSNAQGQTEEVTLLSPYSTLIFNFSSPCSKTSLQQLCELDSKINQESITSSITFQREVWTEEFLQNSALSSLELSMRFYLTSPPLTALLSLSNLSSLTLEIAKVTNEELIALSKISSLRALTLFLKLDEHPDITEGVISLATRSLDKFSLRCRRSMLSSVKLEALEALSKSPSLQHLTLRHCCSLKTLQQAPTFFRNNSTVQSLVLSNDDEINERSLTAFCTFLSQRNCDLLRNWQNVILLLAAKRSVPTFLSNSMLALIPCIIQLLDE